VDLDAREPGVGAGEIEELEDAERSAAVGRRRLQRHHTVSVDQHGLAAIDLAHELGADEVERAGLRRGDPVVADPSEAERAHASRVAKRDQAVLRERDARERAVQLRDRAGDRLFERGVVVRDQRRDHLAVGGRVDADAAFGELLAELGGVRQVAVVPERDRSRSAVVHDRLRVAPVRRAGRRVARVPDRELAAEALELLL
jgi:hypothetical protein